ncbi:MAG: TetR/AcrR family transcriptional regulator [Bacteroidota bacterium]
MENDKQISNDLELKNRIMITARDLFYMYGFSKVTVDEIANKLGISKKTLYKLFPSKDELVHEVVRTTIKEMDACCVGVMKQDDVSFVEKLKQLMTTVGMQYSKMNRQLIEDLEKYAPSVWKEIADYRTEHIQQNFAKLLTEGVEDGVFRNDVNKDLILLIYSNLVRNIITPEILMQLPFTAAQVFDAIMVVLYEGIFTEETRKQYQVHH